MKIQRSINRIFLAPPMLFFLLVMSGQASAQRIIKFDAPNSGTIPYAGTYPAAINQPGTVTGQVTDDNYGTHGFVGTPAGGFTDFDAPGADPIVGCTCPAGINDLGVVTGTSIDTNGVGHGFVRSPDGRITTFDDSQAPIGAGANQGTFPSGINDIGEIAGGYVDGNGALHGFVRAPDGRITTFDAPGASGGTFVQSINNFGVIAGLFYDTNGTGHGFVRTASGQITTFDPPHSVTGPTSYGIYSAYINDLGVIAGSYYDATTDVERGFIRWPDDQYAEFAAPGAGTVVTSSDEAGTNVSAINLEGMTTGNILDNNFESHSFVRTANGEAKTFDIPGQIHVSGMDAGSIGLGINALGIIVGRWRDPNETFHGYLRIP
jgi:hypothetical protein